MSDFSVSSTQAQWSYSVFLLVVGVMIPLSAYISRRFRARSIFFFSLIIFLLGSLICYFSTSLIILIIGRILQGIGNGIIMPYVQILLLRTIPEEKWQTYMGLYGLVIAIAPVLGSFIGGFVITFYGWRALFSFFTVATIILLLLGIIFVKDNTPTEDYPLDYLSVVLSIIGCAFSLLFTTGISSYLIGIVDGFITEFCILFLIVLQSIIFTWFYDIEGLIPILNENSRVKVGKWWVIILKYILPILLLIMWASGVYNLTINSSVFEKTVFGVIGLVIIILCYVFTKTGNRAD
jgi:MFS family permease